MPRTTKLQQCQNPNCKLKVTGLIGRDVEGHGSLRMCGPCRSYLKRYGGLRPVDVVKKAVELKRRIAAKGKYCHNTNCRTTDLQRGMFGKHNGKFYCNLCAIYVNSHDGVERPKSAIEAMKKPKEPPYCENPNCREKSNAITRAEVEGEGMFRLCPTCYVYNKKHKVLRPLERVKATQETRARRKARQEGGVQRCFNKNCRTTLLEGGMYGKHNHEFYCRACGSYVNKMGRERSKSIVEANPMELVSCDNENCDVKSILCSNVTVPGRPHPIYLCPACYAHLRRTKELRTVELVDRCKAQKKRRIPGQERCHNPNCETVDLYYGHYWKDEQYYCSACLKYMEENNGEMRPKELADRSKLYKSRYMWRLKHPDRVVDEVDE